jgi:hypothetical protein
MARAGAWVERQQWTLERFGLTPSKLPTRAFGGHRPRVFCVSIPKAGTHLLERALCLHPGLYRKLLPTISQQNIARVGGFDGLLGKVRPGQIIVSHMRHEPGYVEALREHRVRSLFLIRDPRAIVVSQIHYVIARKDHRHHALFASIPTASERLRVAIAGDPEHGVASIGERLDAFEGWLTSDALVVRFEDLVGPAGGGDAEAQARTVRAIEDHLGIAVPDERFRAICASLFSAASPTFRQGSVQRWRASFDDELDALLRSVAGEALTRYGYDPEATASA